MPNPNFVLLYVESITQARKFMSAARAAGRTKPVAVIKAGRSAAGAKAALSHTGALAGADAVYDAAFRRAGLLQSVGHRFGRWTDSLLMQRPLGPGAAEPPAS